MLKIVLTVSSGDGEKENQAADNLFHVILGKCVFISYKVVVSNVSVIPRVNLVNSVRPNNRAVIIMANLKN